MVAVACRPSCCGLVGGLGLRTDLRRWHEDRFPARRLQQCGRYQSKDRITAVGDNACNAGNAKHICGYCQKKTMPRRKSRPAPSSTASASPPTHRTAQTIPLSPRHSAWMLKRGWRRSGATNGVDELSRVRLRETQPGTVRLDHDSRDHDDRAVAIGIAVAVLLGTITTSAGREWPEKTGSDAFLRPAQSPRRPGVKSMPGATDSTRTRTGVCAATTSSTRAVDTVVTDPRTTESEAGGNAPCHTRAEWRR